MNFFQIGNLNKLFTARSYSFPSLLDTFHSFATYNIIDDVPIRHQNHLNWSHKMYNENNMQYNGLTRSEAGNITSNYQSRSSRSRISQERLSQERLSQDRSSRSCACSSNESRGSNSYNSRSSFGGRNCGCGRTDSHYQDSRQDNCRQDNYQDDRNSSNGCQSRCESNWGLSDHPLAMMYSPYQSWRNVYKNDTALERGTMFAELDLPFEGSNCRR